MKYWHIAFCVLFAANIHAQNDEFRNKGLFNITQVGFELVNHAELDGISLPVDDAGATSIRTITGYFILPHLSAGVGFGLDRHNNPGANTVPLFLDV